jgi:phosphoribosyl-ATP pyrophosphohydrolase
MSDTRSILAELTQVLEARMKASPDSSYVAKLHSKGQDAILKKVGEEAVELVMASKDQSIEKVIYEAADLWFHTMVLLSWHGLSADDVVNELARRMGVSGLDEKASRKE